MSDPTREQRIADLRTLLDFLAAHPDVPLSPYGFELNVSLGEVGDSDEDGRAEVDRIADALGVQPTDLAPTHHRAVIAFGSAQYAATYIDRHHMEDHYAQQRHLKECAALQPTAGVSDD